MKIPNKLKVGGHMFKVSFPYHFRECSDLGQVGKYGHEIRITDIDKQGHKLPTSMTEMLFVHEVLHAIDIVYNTTSLSEETVSRLSEGLYQVLKDNLLLR